MQRDHYFVTLSPLGSASARAHALTHASTQRACALVAVDDCCAIEERIVVSVVSYVIVLHCAHETQVEIAIFDRSFLTSVYPEGIRISTREQRTAGACGRVTRESSLFGKFAIKSRWTRSLFLVAQLSHRYVQGNARAIIVPALERASSSISPQRFGSRSFSSRPSPSHASRNGILRRPEKNTATLR